MVQMDNTTPMHVVKSLFISHVKVSVQITMQQATPFYSTRLDVWLRDGYILLLAQTNQCFKLRRCNLVKEFATLGPVLYFPIYIATCAMYIVCSHMNTQQLFEIMLDVKLAWLAPTRPFGNKNLVHCRDW